MMGAEAQQEDFRDRVNAVFGALDTSSNGTEAWSLSETQVNEASTMWHSSM